MRAARRAWDATVRRVTGAATSGNSELTAASIARRPGHSRSPRPAGRSHAARGRWTALRYAAEQPSWWRPIRARNSVPP